MAIQIKKRPYKYCFTGNPVHYELYSAAAAADPSIYFEVFVFFNGNNGTGAVTQPFEYAAVAGYAEVNIQDILEGFLEYELPDFSGTERDVRPALGAMGKAWIAFREVTLQNSNAGFDNSEEEFAPWIIKGGISMFKYQGNNFFTHYYNVPTPMAPRPFLTWQKSNRLAAYHERMYLLYLLIDDLQGASIEAVAKVTYTDGSYVEYSTTLPTVQNRLLYIPSGAAQWGFSQAKQIWYWEITVKANITLNNPDAISESFRYYADNRHDENDITLHYRNSLGGLDSVRIRGLVEYNLEYTYDEQQRIQRPDYFSGHYFDPQKTIGNNKELLTFRGDVGHLQHEEQDRLRDAFQKRETWWEMGGLKWVPVNIITKSLKQKTSGDNRWSLPIDFTLAHEGDLNYTPDSVDIGTASFASNVCLAVVGITGVSVADGASGFKAVSVTFVEVDPDNASAQFKWRVVKESDGTDVLPWATSNYAASPLQFNVPTGLRYFFEARAICANAVVGNKAQALVNAGANTPGGTTNSQFQSYWSSAADFVIKRNGVAIATGNVGVYSNVNFFCALGTGIVIVLELQNLSPATANIADGATAYTPGVIQTVGTTTTITFPAMDIATGLTVYIG